MHLESSAKLNIRPVPVLLCCPSLFYISLMKSHVCVLCMCVPEGIGFRISKAHLAEELADGIALRHFP
jgi:hypothetical protein